jgi:arsenite oxidase large subunit
MSRPPSLQNPPRSKPARDPAEQPTADYAIVTTACQYCVVACGYEAHVWKPGIGSEKPPELEQALWVSAAMTERVRFGDGERVAAVVPDPKCPLNKSNHSPRGGTQGRDLVAPPGSEGARRDSTRERITTPYVRTQNGWEPITMDAATTIVAQLIRAATDAQPDPADETLLRFRKPGGLGAKIFEYQYLENTYVATKLLYQLVGTPNVAFHDRPSVASNTQGFNDSGLDPHGYAYEDVWSSDVLFLAGSNPYESQSVFFMQAMAGKKIIVLDPRRTITADYAEKTGGLHLQPTVLGADLAVLNALCRYIVEQRYGTDAKPAKKPIDWGLERLPRDLIAADALVRRARRMVQLGSETSTDTMRWAHFHLSLEEFLDFIRKQPSLEDAAGLSGIPLARLELAARWLSGPEKKLPAAPQRKVSLIFEKGLIWGYSYASTAAIANLGLLLGSVLPLSADGKRQPEPRLGVTGRAGGHQKGWCEARHRVVRNGKTSAVGYPYYNATDKYRLDWGDGTPPVWMPTHHYLDPHLVGEEVAPRHPLAVGPEEPDVRLLWVIGANAVGQIGNAAAKWKAVDARRGAALPASAADALATLGKRIANGGLVVVQQDIFPNPTTAHADLVLPAAGWGEEDFTRFNGERRLRLYGKFQEPPAHGDGTETRALPDWRIFQLVAQKLLDGFAAGHGLPDGTSFAPDPDASGAQTAPLRPLTAQDFTRTKTSEIFADFATRQAIKRAADFDHSSMTGNVRLLGNGHTLLRERGTAGFVLPVWKENDKHPPNANEPLRDSLRAPVKADRFSFASAVAGEPKIVYGPYVFVRADWATVRDEFMHNLPRAGEVAVCNGRINELWNSLFSHIRNETVRARWPDDLPGTFLEISPAAAAHFSIAHGDAVRLVCDDIHFGAKRGAFDAVAIVQPGVLPAGVVFAYFSYPAHRARLPEFPHRDFSSDGYVNNLSSGYVDPMNPIAAVKFARARLEKPDEPRNFAHRLTAVPRSLAFAVPRFEAGNDTPARRAEWKLRELIVQKALPRAAYHGASPGDDPIALLRDPDEFVEALSKMDDDTKAARQRLLRLIQNDLMEWNEAWPDPTGRLLDGWSDAEKKVFRDWVESLDGAA